MRLEGNDKPLKGLPMGQGVRGHDVYLVSVSTPLTVDTAVELSGTHGAPLLHGAGAVQVLWEVWVPVPHVPTQPVVLLQSVQPPSAINENEASFRYSIIGSPF